MRIGELAERAGVSVRSLRYYEEQGLLTSGRTPRGQRTFVESDVDRVRFLQHLFGAGLSSRTIVELLPCVDSPSAEQTDETWGRLLEERARLDDHIVGMLQARDALDAVIAANRRHADSYVGAAS